jgi:hypothetical protein
MVGQINGLGLNDILSFISFGSGMAFIEISLTRSKIYDIFAKVVL